MRYKPSPWEPFPLLFVLPAAAGIALLIIVLWRGILQNPTASGAKTPDAVPASTIKQAPVQDKDLEQIAHE